MPAWQDQGHGLNPQHSKSISQVWYSCFLLLSPSILSHKDRIQAIRLGQQGVPLPAKQSHRACFSFFCFYFQCVWEFCLHVCVGTMCVQYPYKPEKGAGTGLTDGFQLWVLETATIVAFKIVFSFNVSWFRLFNKEHPLTKKCTWGRNRFRSTKSKPQLKKTPPCWDFTKNQLGKEK